MAVETEKTVVLNIDAQPGIKSMKDLKQAIKDGKDQLAGLTEGTKEYEQVLSHTAELQHQYREIQEQVNRSTMDFGQTLSNVNSVLSGGVAAIQGVTAGLSLMGVDLGDDDKLTKNLVKSMSLLQAMSKMDAAVKGFKALTVGIKGSITAAGGLGKALKALAVSNPFTAILAGITAVIAAGAALINMFQKAKDAEEALKDATIFDEIDSSMKEMEWSFEEMHRRMKLEGKSAYEIMEADQKALLKRINELEAESIRLYKRLEDASKDRRESIQAEIDKVDQLKQKYMEQREYNTRMRDIMYEEDQKRQKEEAEKQANAAKQAANARVQAAQAAQQKLEQQQANAYKHELELLKQNNSKIIREEEVRYRRELQLAGNNLDKLEDAEIAHQKRMMEIDNEYLQKQIELAQERVKILEGQNKGNSKQSDIDALNTQIQEMTYQIARNTEAYEDNARALQIVKTEREIELELLEKQTNLINQQSQAQQNAWSVSHKAAQQEIEDANEKLLKWGAIYAVLQKFGLGNDITQPYNDAINALTADIDQLNLANQGLQDQMDGLTKSFQAGTIGAEDYNNQMADLGAQHLANQRDIADKELEIERNKQEKKKALALQGAMAINSITTSMVSVLNSLAEAEDMSFEESKKLKIAAAIISTIQGGLVAFLTTMEAVGGGPWGIAAGAAASAAVVAAGMIEVQKIRNTKKDSTPSLTNSALSSVTAPVPQIVNLNAVNDEIELPDTRVYVLESDITDAQRRVNVVENNSNF